MTALLQEAEYVTVPDGIKAAELLPQYRERMALQKCHTALRAAALGTVKRNIRPA